MNDYRTTILFDLYRSVRMIHRGDVEGQTALHLNIGYWLNRVPDVVEQNKWMELFVLELAKTAPGLHEDYLWAAVRKWVGEANEVKQ